MRLRSALLLLIALVLAGLGAAAWLLPARIDWRERRAEIEAAAAGVLGRPVQLREDFSLSLLPAPRIAARGLSVEDVGDGFSIAAREVRVNLRFWPLLAGRVIATDIVLVQPTIALSGISPPPFPARLAPAWIANASVRIEEGTLSLGGFRISGIAARVSGEGSGGPFALDGEAMAAGRQMRLSARLDRADTLGIARLEVALATLAGPRLEFDATGLLALATLTFSGRGHAALEDLSALIPAPVMPAQLEADRLIASPGGLVAEALRLTLVQAAGRAGPPATAVGAANFRPSPARLDVDLSFGILDLDPWLVPAAGMVGKAGLPVSLALGVASATLKGATVRDLKLQARVEQGQAAINQLSAQLPGAAAIGLSGAAQRVDDALRFEGEASLDAADLRAMLDWLGWPTDWAAPGRLHAAKASAQVTLGAGLLQLAGLDAVLDGVRLAGGLVLNTAAARPSFGAGLTVERVAPESWLAPALLEPSALAARLAGIDANLRLETPIFALRGIEAHAFSLDATLEAGRLSVRRLAAELAGARGVLAGALTLAPAPRVAELHLDVDVSEAAGLLPLLPPVLALPGLWTGPGLLRLSGQSADAGLAVEAEAELAGARLEARGTLDLAQPRYAGSIALRHPGARRLLAAAGWQGLADWVGDGSLSVLGQAELGPDRLALSGFELVAGGVRGGGDLSLARGAVPALAGKLAFESLDLPLPDPRGGPLPVGLLRESTASLALSAGRMTLGPIALQAVETELRLGDGKAGFPRFAALWAGGRLGVSAVLDIAAPTPSLQASLEVQNATITGPLSGLPLDLAAGQVVAEADVSAQGFGLAAWRATLGGQGGFAVTQGVLAGFDLAQAAAALRQPGGQAETVAKLRAALSGGASAFDRLEGAFKLEAGSLVVDQAMLSAEAGTAQLSGSVDLVRDAIVLDARLQPAGAEALPELGLRLGGAASAPRRVIETAAAARWLAERAAR